MTKRKTQPIQPETVVNPVQVLHMDDETAEAVGAFIDYRASISDPVSIQQAMRLLVKRGWATIAAQAEEQGK